MGDCLPTKQVKLVLMCLAGYTKNEVKWYIMSLSYKDSFCKLLPDVEKNDTIWSIVYFTILQQC